MPATTNDGTTFDDFLRDEGIFDEVVAEAEARVRAWQILNQPDAGCSERSAVARTMPLGTSDERDSSLRSE